MRNMSFMLTTEQMYDRIKDVTRRVGWWNLKPGDEIMAVEKGMGLKKGEKVKHIYPIFIISAIPEPLNRMVTDLDYGFAEVKREGFHNTTPAQFIHMLARYGQKVGIVRTAIYLGLVYIGDAIGKPSYAVTGNDVVTVMAIALLVFAVMDVVDFFRNRKAG